MRNSNQYYHKINVLLSITNSYVLIYSTHHFYNNRYHPQSMRNARSVLSRTKCWVSLIRLPPSIMPLQLVCVAVCCSVLQCDAVCCSVVQRGAAMMREVFLIRLPPSIMPLHVVCVAVSCSVLQSSIVWCSVLQCAAVCAAVMM